MFGTIDGIVDINRVDAAAVGLEVELRVHIFRAQQQFMTNTCGIEFRHGFQADIEIGVVFTTVRLATGQRPAVILKIAAIDTGILDRGVIVADVCSQCQPVIREAFDAEGRTGHAGL